MVTILVAIVDVRISALVQAARKLTAISEPSGHGVKKPRRLAASRSRMGGKPLCGHANGRAQAGFRTAENRPRRPFAVMVPAMCSS